MWTWRNTILAAIAIALCATMCSGCGYGGEEDLYGMHLVTDSDLNPNFGYIYNSPEFRPRLRKLMERAAAYWSMNTDMYKGWRLRIKNSDGVWCDGEAETHTGCTDFLNNTITIQIEGNSCIEMTAFFHEVGHLAFYPWGDPWHWDRLWWDREGMNEAWHTIKREDIPADDPCQDLSWTDANDVPPSWRTWH